MTTASWTLPFAKSHKIFQRYHLVILASLQRGTAIQPQLQIADKCLLWSLFVSDLGQRESILLLSNRMSPPPLNCPPLFKGGFSASILPRNKQNLVNIPNVLEPMRRSGGDAAMRDTRRTKDLGAVNKCLPIVLHRKSLLCWRLLARLLLTKADGIFIK